ncbi:MAG: SRPBCC family protein [Pseudomonadota bacterium]
MDRSVELSLIDELLALKASNTPFLDDAVATSPVSRYLSEDRFSAEQRKIFRRLPNAAAHVSELPENGSFLRREVGGAPVLITRDKEGAAHAFLNVCRHRGTRLVDEPSGCKHRFSCPYHAWTYSSAGDLIGAPHFDVGFPGRDKADLGLTRLACVEKHGFIWVHPSVGERLELEAWLDGLSADLDALGMAAMRIAAEDDVVREANWKILVEGGIEAYHFRVAHRSTIGPHFEDNLSSYQSFGPHMRAALPRTSMASLTEEARDRWRLRDHANVLYTLFPSSQLLVMQDHIVWIRQEPLAPGRTALRLATLAPPPAEGEQGGDDAHWKRNHQITMTTLDEDFLIGESIQASASSGANDVMLFGRFEGALAAFNNTVSAMLECE